MGVLCTLLFFYFLKIGQSSEFPVKSLERIATFTGCPFPQKNNLSICKLAFNFIQRGYQHSSLILFHVSRLTPADSCERA